MVNVLLPFAAILIMGTQAMSSPLESHRWEERPLLVFSPAGDERLLKQRQELDRGRPGLDDRDMLVLLVEGDGPIVAVAGAWSPDGASNTDLRRAYQVEQDEFAAILVGKDGGEKGRWAEPVALEEVFALIDSMPMRQQEMQSRS